MNTYTYSADDAAWAKTCTDELKKCVQLATLKGRERWQQFRRGIPADPHPRIWDADFNGSDLSGYDLSRCKLLRTKFVGGNLGGTKFGQSILRDCDLSRADLRGADFDQADIRSSILRGVSVDDRTNFTVMKGRLAEDMDLTLRDMAEAAWRRAEFDADPSKSWLQKGIVRLIGYGTDLRRLVLLALVIIVAFAVVFQIGDAANTTFWEALVYSLQYFVALSDPYAEQKFCLSALGTAEACLGLLFLAMLLSAIARRIVLER